MLSQMESEEEPQRQTLPYKYFHGFDKNGVEKQGFLWMDVYEPYFGLDESIRKKRASDWLDDLESLSPASIDPPRIPIIIVHGGAWDMGSTLFPVLESWWTLIKHHRYRVFLIEYRLSGCQPVASQLATPEKTCWAHPAAVEDLRDAVAFVKTNATEFNIDPERVILIGDSAGGHLALLHAARSSRPDREDILPCPDTSALIPIPMNLHCDTSVAGVASFYPPVDFESMIRNSETSAYTLYAVSKYTGIPEGVLYSLAEGDTTAISEEDMKKFRDADVLSSIHPGMPPIFFSHSDGDSVVPPVTTMRFEQRLHEITAAEAWLLKDLPTDDRTFLDVDRSEFGLPHAYMFAMAGLGKSFYLEEMAGYNDLQKHTERGYLENVIRTSSNPKEALHELDLRLREWIDRVDQSKD